MKYNWTSKIINGIEWKLNAAFIRQQSYATKKIMKKFSHRWLASGSKNFGQNLIYLHCKGKNESKIDHDHFITYEQSTSRESEIFKN